MFDSHDMNPFAIHHRQNERLAVDIEYIHNVKWKRYGTSGAVAVILVCLVVIL